MSQKTKKIFISLTLAVAVLVAALFMAGGVDDTNKFIEAELRQEHYHKVSLPKY